MAKKNLFVTNHTVTAEERYLNSLVMVNGTNIEDGKANRIAYLSGLLSDPIRRGAKRVIVYVKGEYLAISRIYQTEFRTNRDSSDLESKFDWNLCGALTATFDRNTGTFVLIDGQNRAKVILKREPDAEIPVMVILYAPDDYAERIKFEAKLFVNQNIATKNVTENEKLEALAEQGDVAAINLLTLLKEYGVERTSKGGKLPQNTIRDASTYKKFISKHGYAGGKWVFDIYKYSGFRAYESAYARQYFKAFGFAYDKYPMYRDEIKDYLIM